MSKPRVATVILAGCTGCHLALLDGHDRFAQLLSDVDLVASPFSGPDEIPECDVILVEGAVSTDHDEEVLLAARQRAKVLVAFGSCATHGGIGGLRNLHATETVTDHVYGDRRDENGLPQLLERVRPVHELVRVDHSIPGCSPETDRIYADIAALLEGRDPARPRRNMCAECHRVHESMLSPSRDFVADAVVSVMELDEIDPDRCFLEQGVICMGPMTREGCGSRCLDANIPCRGCVGPSRPEFDQGGKMIDALGAVLPAGAIMFMDDIVGTGYRFTLPVSVFPAAYQHEEGDDA